MIQIAAVALFALSIGGVVYFVLSGVKVKSGWQKGNGPIARWLDERRRSKFNDQLSGRGIKCDPKMFDPDSNVNVTLERTR